MNWHVIDGSTIELTGMTEPSLDDTRIGIVTGGKKAISQKRVGFSYDFFAPLEVK